MTKREARAQAAKWREALQNGRVVRIAEFPDELTSYPTIEMRDAAFEEARAAGLTPEIVRPPRSQP